MSIIRFKCAEEQKENVKNVFWDILLEHYYDSVYPNTKVEYKNEGDNIYKERLNELMLGYLCKVEATDDGVNIHFDSTEDAGFAIADNVYRTGMGYSDDGLTYLRPLFMTLVEKLPDICFEAECECADKWIYEEYECSYDGKTFESSAEWDEFE